MSKIKIPASRAMIGPIVVVRIVTAPPLVCASPELIVPISRRTVTTRCLSVTSRTSFGSQNTTRSIGGPRSESAAKYPFPFCACQK